MKKKIIIITIITYTILGLIPFLIVSSFNSYGAFEEFELKFNEGQITISKTDSTGGTKQINVSKFNLGEFIKVKTDLYKNALDLEAAEFQLYNTFTGEIQKAFGSKLSLDTLNQILDVCDGLAVLGEVSPENKILYSSLVDHWYNISANSLAAILKENNALKYSFKYQSLKRRCEHLKYFSSIPSSSLEKVIYNLLNNNYSYVVNRVWLRTGIFEKVILFLFLGFVFITSLVGVINIYEKIFKKNIV